MAKKYELKTQATASSVEKFLNGVKDPSRRADCFAAMELMKSVTKEEPTMWGPSIVGFGRYHYKYASGHEGDMCATGFSPRKDSLTFYLMCGFDGQTELMKKLGKYKTGKCCLYVKKLEDIHLPTLKKLVADSVKFVKKAYPA